MDMRGYAHADIPCPSCGNTPNAIVYVRSPTATLFCQACYQAWTMERTSHPSLLNVRDAMEPMPQQEHHRLKR